jgi:hypothetical protein
MARTDKPLAATPPEAANVALGAKLASMTAARNEPRKRQGFDLTELAVMVRLIQADIPWREVKARFPDINDAVLEGSKAALYRRAGKE